MGRRSGLFPAPIEFLPRRFYLVVVRERPICSIHRTKDDNSNPAPTSERLLFPRTPGIQFVSLQEQLPSSSEFVLGIQQTIRFNSFLTSILSAATSPPEVEDPAALRHPEGSGPGDVHYFFLRRRHLREEIQAIHLICRWRLLHLQLPPREALAPFEHLPYLFSSFLSSSTSFDPPNLLVSLAGIAKGQEKELLGPVNAANSTSGSAWDALREHSDDEPNLWTISRRFVVYGRQGGAESGRRQTESKPDDESAELEDTISALKRRRVSLVVTLSKMHSDASTFASRGLEILDISSSISASPSMSPLNDKLPPSDEVLVSRFLEACEVTGGLIAVNGWSGSGCTSAATCIGCYLMKHANFTSQEAIGWLQLCRPAKIPMAWELFLGRMQSQMWLEGERFRRVGKGDPPDDITSSAASDSTHINIGKISLGRLSLLGTRDRDKHRADSHVASIPVSTCLSSRTQEPQQSPTAATTTAQLKRRPLTQGSTGTRRYHRSTDGTSLRADFALMHKFLHQTPTVSPSTANANTSSLHSVPSRPKASARPPDGTPANCTEALA
ncbi:Dual specificity protein phosphatase cdc14a [Phytophthora pseudosyringae]|uniref:Dual specificity protein phosphatase cdc14a n=1 Tax=Phytophthora pseudosyringae TaxID=221518 RepID=A0A8T1W1D1_9STRA|nr:Dual specificity protein phosphatase cdc14a [Phytophthora pseudosyringae]